MNTYKFLLIFFVGFLSAQQTGKCSFSNRSLSEEGKIFFAIKNISGKKMKVPIKYPGIWARPTDIQIYNEDKKDYETTTFVADDIDCFNTDGCFGKMTCLKKGEMKEYEVQIIPGRILKAFKEKKKYRFKLAFDTYLFTGCKDYITDWLYYQN